MPYNNTDNSGIAIISVPSSHMNSMHQQYGGFHPHFQGHMDPRYGNLKHAAQPPFKSEIHDPHNQHSIMTHSHLMTQTTLPAVSSVSSQQQALSPVSPTHSNEYHLHNLHHQTYGHHSPPLEHAQPNPEPSSYHTVSPVSLPSPPPQISTPTTNLRFEIVLEAPTAAAQRIDETPMTYLNKGQYYGICLNDQEKYDGDLTSTLKVMFHDDTHRKMASTYWGFWLGQQTSPKTARAIDIDKAASTGIKNVETKAFDRISFQWNGKKGCKIFLRWNCLSTDFSRIKGVKGIPLRAHVDTKCDETNFIERSFAKIKLFRDKGAERKNKDDQRHLEKMYEKMRGKCPPDTNPLIMMFAPVTQVSVFNETVTSNDLSDDDDALSLSENLANLDSDPDAADLVPIHIGKRRRFSFGPDYPDLLEVDPTYIPQLRKKRAVLCIYVKLPGESVFRAVYLNHLTVQDLIQKLSQKLDLQGQVISNILRVTKRGLSVRVDDELVQRIDDEQDMEMEYEFVQDGSVNITLKF